MIYYKTAILRWLKPLIILGLLLEIPFLALESNAQNSSTEPLLCEHDLPSAIEAIINRPGLVRSRWGIVVQTLERNYQSADPTDRLVGGESNRSIYNLNGYKYFTPASTAKLLTTAAALLELNANFRVRTPIYGVGDPPHLTSLRIKGQGDPTISVKTLKNIVLLLQQLGIERIEKLIVEDNYFPQPTINPTWEWLDVYSYFATSVNSLILNENTVSLTLLPQQLGQPVALRWSDAIAARQWQVENKAVTAPQDTPYNVEINGVLGEPILKIRGELALNNRPDVWDLAIVDPANYFLESWRYLLTKSGIKVQRGEVVYQTQSDKSEIKLATINSPLLHEILSTINQSSNNLYAEALMQILAKQSPADTGVKAVEQSLSKLGVNPKDYTLVDGSGLSRHNLITPQMLVKVLSLMASSPQYKTYRNSLALAGVNGTLKKRFRDTVVQGNLWGKTGSLTGVATLAGYLNLPQGENLVLSIMVNNSDRSGRELRQAIDEIVLLLSRLEKC